MFRLWRFLVELLLKLPEADEGYKCGTGCRRGRAEVILGQILESVGRIVRRGCAAGGTVVVYRVLLFDVFKRKLTIHDERSALTEPIATSRLVQTTARASLAMFPSASCCIPFLALLREGKKRQNSARVKRYWEITADKLSKAGWSWGCIAAIDSDGRTIWIVDAHRDNGKRFVARNEEKLTAFLELERVTRE